MDTEHKSSLQLPSAGADTSHHAQNQSQPDATSGSHQPNQDQDAQPALDHGVQPQHAHDGEPKEEANEEDAVADASAVPAICAAEAAKKRKARQRKPTFDEQQAALLGAYAPTRRRASTKAAALLRDQAMAEFTDSDYMMDDYIEQPRSKGKGSKQEDHATAHAHADLEESPEPEKMDVLLGCTKCRYLKKGCGACRDKPSLERPASLRWKPDAGKEQKVNQVVICFFAGSKVT